LEFGNGLAFIADVKKTFRFRDAFFATTAYAAILFSERNDDKRCKQISGESRGARMKKFIILSAAFLVLIGVGYFVHLYWASRSNPCADIFEQTVISLEGKINALKAKGEPVLDPKQLEKLADRSAQIAADLKSCCILFNTRKIDFEAFLKCQDEFNQYARSIDHIGQLADETAIAKQQKRYDLVNLRLSYLERQIADSQQIAGHFQEQIKALDNPPAEENSKSVRVARKSVIDEKEPNDSYKQGMEIPIGVVNGALSEHDRQDVFRFELDAGNVLNLDFAPADGSENLKAALRNFGGNELWNSGQTAPGTVKSTRMMMSNISGGIYYIVVFSGSGPYRLDLFVETQNDAGSGADAGDNITSALLIKPDLSYFGELGGLDDSDWYRFDIPAGRILNLAFAPDESAESMKFSLRNFERSEIWYSGEVAPGARSSKRVMMNNSSGGTYYREAAAGRGRYAFEIFLEKQNDAGSETDAGDKISEALKIEAGRSYSGELGGFDDNDWYRFEAPAGSVLKLSLSAYEGSEPIKFSFRDPQRAEVWFTEEIPPGTTESKRIMINRSSGGTYFLEAFFGSGPYGFEVLLENQNDGDSGTDAGDAITEALEIKPERVIAGELGGLDREDWYMFSPQAGRVIQFTSDRDGEPLKLSMGNVARGEVLYTAELTPGLTESFEIPKDVRPPYFLKVYAGSGKYSFKIK
jgi:hypothetical protein